MALALDIGGRLIDIRLMDNLHSMVPFDSISDDNMDIQLKFVSSRFVPRDCVAKLQLPLSNL